MNRELAARLLASLVLLGVPVGVLLARKVTTQHVAIHGVMADNGGWTPGTIEARVGEPLTLHLTSDDVIHGFAIGQSEHPAVDVMPGAWTKTKLVFARPGRYTFYCTRWCGSNHWRMRGTIEVSGPGAEVATDSAPLFVRLKLDLDAPHPSGVVPTRMPVAARGTEAAMPFAWSLDEYRSRSPVALFRTMRERAPKSVTDSRVWDVVATVWRDKTTAERLAVGRKLYRENCAACHGESGRGNGVMAAALAASAGTAMAGMTGHTTASPTDFTDAATMLGASPAFLHGKIIRGGMGTGMPYWGPIFNDTQVWALVDYLWTFQFAYEWTAPPSSASP
ncbi:MAG: c-type cytochrome [Gemmatimonadetes bacterium]|nr:c-type cytochrome [Gemmatimonadota bacterium]